MFLGNREQGAGSREQGGLFVLLYSLDHSYEVHIILSLLPLTSSLFPAPNAPHVAYGLSSLFPTHNTNLYKFAKSPSAPCSLLPAPCSLLPAPCSLFPAPYSLLPTP